MTKIDVHASSLPSCTDTRVEISTVRHREVDISQERQDRLLVLVPANFSKSQNYEGMPENRGAGPLRAPAPLFSGALSNFRDLLNLNYGTMARQIWELAHATGLIVQLLGLCKDVTEEYVLRRGLAAMSARCFLSLEYSDFYLNLSHGGLFLFVLNGIGRFLYHHFIAAC